MLKRQLSYYCIFYFLLVLIPLSPSVVFSAGEPDLNYADRINNSEVRTLFKEKKYWPAMRKARELNLSSDEGIISEFFDRTILRDAIQRSKPPLIRPIKANYAERINNSDIRALFNEKKYMRAINKARVLEEDLDKNIIYEFIDDTIIHTSEEIHDVEYSLGLVNGSDFIPGTMFTSVDNLYARLPNESVTSIGDIKIYVKSVQNRLHAAREKLSYQFSRELNVDLVPPNNSQGTTVYSLAIDEEDYADLSVSNIEPLFNNTRGYQQLEGFDYLIGQYNRNLGNYFVSKTDGSVLLIDNNSSFYAQAENGPPTESDLLRPSNPLPKRSMANFFTDDEWSTFSQKDLNYFDSWFDSNVTVSVDYFEVSKAEFLERIKLFREKILVERIPSELVPNIEAVSEEVIEEVFLAELNKIASSESEESQISNFLNNLGSRCTDL